MQILKADTLIKVIIGPVVAVGDGFTPITTLSLSTADEAEVMKHNAAAVTSISGNTFAAITSMDGYYNLTITAAQLDTEGMLTVGINDDSLCLPVRHDFMVVNANVYDSIYAAAATDYLQTDTLQIGGSTQSATDLKDFADAGYDPATNKVEGVKLADTLTTYTSNTVQTGDNYARLGAPAGADVSTDIAAIQTSVSSLANVGSAVHKPAASYTLTAGTQSANTVSDTEALNGTRHTHTDTAGVMELYYEFNIGSGTPSSVQVSGYVTGNNDDLDVYGYDWVASSWKQIGNIDGSSATTNSVYSFDMFVDMVGNTANEGIVRVRFYKASGLTSATLAVDQIFVAFSQGAEGYENGAVWLDTGASNTNTVVGVDGVSRNPVSTIAAANTLLASTNLRRIMVAPGSSITLAASQVDQIFMGHDWTLALGSQDISGTYFQGSTVSGVGTTPTGQCKFIECELGAVSLGLAHFEDCSLDTNTKTLTAAGNYAMNACYSIVAGTATPIIDFGAVVGNTNLIISGYSNGIEISNLNGTGADNFSISGDGQIIYSASSSGTVQQRGNWKVTNTGGVTINKDDNSTTLDDWDNGGRLDLLLDALITQIDTATTEPGQGALPLSAKMALKIDYLYKLKRNKADQTATTFQSYDDAGTTVDHKSTDSSDGTTAVKGELVSGP